jgi:hypothetical protein
MPLKTLQSYQRLAAYRLQLLPLRFDEKAEVELQVPFHL